MHSLSFSDLGLSPALVKTVAAQGYSAPTEVQERAIPVLLSGANLLGTAQTGTGKTAAFTLPLLHRLMESERADGRGGGTPGSGDGGRRESREAAGRNARRSNSRKRTNSKTSRSRGPARPEALIVAPTREMAIQIDESVGTYGARSGITHTAVFGGAPKGRQLEALRRNPVVLAATPGRLRDFVGDGAIDLSGVRYFILDEADRMLDMGFIPDVRTIAALVSEREQTALFSATMPDEVKHLAREILGEGAERISVAPKAVTADGIKQSVLHMERTDKISMLPELILDRRMQRVLVFTRTKHRAAKVAKVLSKAGIPADEIHGNRSQNQRQRALERFRSGRIQALVGTDVAARGIDVDDISHVINYEIPHEPETYVHRIGRTARAGMEGEALSLCDVDEVADFRRIEGLLKGAVDVDRSHRAQVEPPPSRRSGNGAGRSNTKGGGRGGRPDGGPRSK